jgi:hypothetical protein
VVDGWCWFVLREKYYWLVADDWWFVMREKYCWLVADGWFVLREKYCWLVADKPNEQGEHQPQSSWSFHEKVRICYYLIFTRAMHPGPYSELFRTADSQNKPEVVAGKDR